MDWLPVIEIFSVGREQGLCFLRSSCECIQHQSPSFKLCSITGKLNSFSSSLSQEYFWAGHLCHLCHPCSVQAAAAAPVIFAHKPETSNWLKPLSRFGRTSGSFSGKKIWKWQRHQQKCSDLSIFTRRQEVVFEFYYIYITVFQMYIIFTGRARDQHCKEIHRNNTARRLVAKPRQGSLSPTVWKRKPWTQGKESLEATRTLWICSNLYGGSEKCLKINSCCLSFRASVEVRPVNERNRTGSVQHPLREALRCKIAVSWRYSVAQANTCTACPRRVM